MGKLLNIAGNWIDPTKVVSVVPVRGENLNNEFFIHVNMGSWTATYTYQNDDDGWNVDSVAEAVNEARQ